MSLQVAIPDNVKKHAKEVAKSVMRSMGNDDFQTSLNNYLDVNGCINRLVRIERRLKVDLKNVKILEIGSGIGMFVVVSRALGLNITGVEPGGGSYHANRTAIDELLNANGLPTSTIIEAEGERCSNYFQHNSFDLVVSFSVLEHVSDPKKVISEISHLLKPGGLLYLTCSNHRSFYESHYGIVWLPFLTRSMARRYVRLWGKSEDFLNELYLIKPANIQEWMKRSGLLLYSMFEPDFNLLKSHNAFDYGLDVMPVLNCEVRNGSRRIAWPAQLLKSFIKTVRLVWLVDKLHLRPMLHIIAQKPHLLCNSSSFSGRR